MTYLAIIISWCSMTNPYKGKECFDKMLRCYEDKQGAVILGQATATKDDQIMIECLKGLK